MPSVRAPVLKMGPNQRASLRGTRVVGSVRLCAGAGRDLSRMLVSIRQPHHNGTDHKVQCPVTTRSSPFDVGHLEHPGLPDVGNLAFSYLTPACTRPGDHPLRGVSRVDAPPLRVAPSPPVELRREMTKGEWEASRLLGSLVAVGLDIGEAPTAHGRRFRYLSLPTTTKPVDGAL